MNAVVDLLGENLVAVECVGDVFESRLKEHLEIPQATIDEFACGVQIDAKGFFQVMSSVVHLAFKDFRRMLVTLDLQLHADKAGGEAGVLTTATDRAVFLSGVT